MLRRAPMVNASKIEGAFVALDEAQDLLIEVESGVPDQGAIAEDPEHHLSMPGERERTGRGQVRAAQASERASRAGGGSDFCLPRATASPPPGLLSPLTRARPHQTPASASSLVGLLLLVRGRGMGVACCIYAARAGGGGGERRARRLVDERNGWSPRDRAAVAWD
jgi:hypothetical protein